MRKILFSDRYGLTTAVLEGRKTMTRRIAYMGELNKPNSGYLTEGKLRGTCALCDSNSIVAKSLYKVGEIVAVAQAYMDVFSKYNSSVSPQDPGYTNKMFVRAAAMLHQIRITNIHIERLQDISDEDCLREGVKTALPPFGYYVDGINSKYPYYEPDTGFRMDMKTFRTPREAFAALIDKVSGKGVWNSNPYVFVYEFELVK